MDASYREDAIFPLIRNVISIRYDDLPAEAIGAAKKSVIDTLGVIVAGSTAEGCNAIARMVQEWGDSEESTILAYGLRVPTRLSITSLQS